MQFTDAEIKRTARQRSGGCSTKYNQIKRELEIYNESVSTDPEPEDPPDVSPYPFTPGDDVLIHWGTQVDLARIAEVKRGSYYVTNLFDDIPSPTGTFGTWVRSDQVNDRSQAVWIEAVR